MHLMTFHHLHSLIPKCNSTELCHTSLSPLVCLAASDLESWDSAVSWIGLFHNDWANKVVIDGGPYPGLQYWFEVAPGWSCLVFNVLSGLVFVAKVLTEAERELVATHQITATHSSSTCSAVQKHYRGPQTHINTPQTLRAALSITTNTAIHCLTAFRLPSLLLSSFLLSLI